jgi:CheY-like chemotaxis protein
VPIIALTANAEPEDADGYLAAGMNGVVEKPMKPEHLLAALQEALGETGAAAAAA